jgi:hypothetical protein
VIALVSSTIFPGDAPVYAESRSVFSPEERLAQTRRTIESLQASGFSNIYLADNSGVNWVDGTEDRLQPARVFRFSQHQFHNRGISELYLLLAMLGALPDDRPILKISGRYALKNNIVAQLSNADVAAKWSADNRTISTRCYVVRDRRLYRRFLEDTLNELYGHAARIVGPRSLLRILKHSLQPAADDSAYFDPSTSIEGAAAAALRNKNYAVVRLAELGLEGEIATSRDRIRE